jgi:hypothetical protein
MAVENNSSANLPRFTPFTDRGGQEEAVQAINGFLDVEGN